MNYYGRRMATCSSDKTIKIYDVAVDNNVTLTSDLRRHEGPVWQVAWAHPKYGTYLASCSYDKKIFIWKEVSKNDWKVVFEFSASLSVNSISWASHEVGLWLACGSSDGYIYILTSEGSDRFQNQWRFEAHRTGVNAVSWAPSTKRLVSGGCDNAVKIWNLETADWRQENHPTLAETHQDWVRDVSWAPNIGLPSTTIASCSQDGEVYIWTQEEGQNTAFNRKAIKMKEVAWRVSWSITGNLLAVSGGDNKVSLFKESLRDGEWVPLYLVDSAGQISPSDSQ